MDSKNKIGSKRDPCGEHRHEVITAIDSYLFYHYLRLDSVP